MGPGMPLLGRGDELERLKSLLRRSAGGEGQVVLVHGAAGIGKTALVRASIATLPQEVAVLVGWCDPLSTPRPFGPLHDVSAGLGDDVVRRLTARDAPHEIFGSVYERLRAASHVLVVEDVHWADEGTLDLLRYLGRRIGGTPSSLVVTYRETELDDRHPLRVVLGDLSRSGTTERISLGALPLEAVERMVAGTGLSANEVHELTGGNAFFITEVVAHPDRVVPDNVRDAVLARAADLDDDALDALRVVACVPGGVTVDVLSRLAVFPDNMRLLISRGLLVWEGPSVRFAHELGRLTILDTIQAPDRLTLHRRVLDALDGTPDGDAALLTHLARSAGRPGDLVRFARRAAEDATAVGAHTDAGAYLEAALGACDVDERAELLEALSHERYVVDRIAEAIAALEEALALRRATASWTAVGTDLRRLSRLHWFAGDRVTAEREASEAIEVLSGTDATVELGFAYGQQATLAMVRWDPASAQSWGDRAMAIADRCDVAELRAQMQNTIGTAQLMAGDEAGRLKLRESVDLSRRLGLDEHTARALVNLGFFLVEARRYDEANEVLDEGMSFTAARELDTWHLYFLGMRARLRLARGHWTAAWDDANEVLSTGGTPLHAIWPLLVLGLLRVRRGDPDPVAPLDEAWTIASGFEELYRMVPIACALAEHEWVTGERGDAAERLTELAAMLPERPIPGAAEEIATWLDRLGMALPDKLGDSALSPPDRTSAEARAAAWTEVGAPYERALALVDTGSTNALLEALDDVVRLGAVTTAGWLRRRLRSHGVAPPAGPRASTRANPAGLTARQVDVLRLLTEGLTNAEIADRLYISEKTAGHHVSAILLKLAVDRRRDAAALARELGLVH